MPVEFQRELELPRIVSRRGLAGVGKQRADSGHVIPVGDVEHVGDQVHVVAFAEINPLGHAHVVEDRPGLKAGIAAQVAVERLERSVEVRAARFLENSRWRVLRRYRRIAKSGTSRVDESVRPDATSMMGAKVQLLKNLLLKQFPPSLPDW